MSHIDRVLSPSVKGKTNQCSSLVKFITRHWSKDKLSQTSLKKLLWIPWIPSLGILGVKFPCLLNKKDHITWLCWVTNWVTNSLMSKKYFNSDGNKQVKTSSTWEEKFCTSMLPCSVLFIIYINSKELQLLLGNAQFIVSNHSNSDLFMCKDNMSSH